MDVLLRNAESLDAIFPEHASVINREIDPRDSLVVLVGNYDRKSVVIDNAGIRNTRINIRIADRERLPVKIGSRPLNVFVRSINVNAVKIVGYINTRKLKGRIIPILIFMSVRHDELSRPQSQTIICYAVCIRP